MAEVAVEMDQEVQDSPFQDKEAYFDGSHSWCVG